MNKVMPNDIVMVKLTNGELLCATFGKDCSGPDSGFFPAIDLTDIASIAVNRDPKDLSRFTYALLPWQADVMTFQLSEIAALGYPNELARGEYEKSFRRILSASINDVAAANGNYVR